MALSDKYCQLRAIGREVKFPSPNVQGMLDAMKNLILKIGLTILILTFASNGFAQDLCSSDLDQVSEARSNLVNAKDEVESAQSDVESAQSNLTMCTSDGEDCSMEEDDYNNAVDHYNEANNELQSATDDYNSAVSDYNQCVESDPPPH